MADRVKAAADARTDDQFYLIARTDSIAVEGVDAAIERAHACVEAGADAIFAEASYDLDTYQRFSQAVSVPLLANITEFGKTPLFSVPELRDVGVGMVLYPLSAFRAMNRAAEIVYETIRKDGHQRNVIDMMQTETNSTTASVITNLNRAWTPFSSRIRRSKRTSEHAGIVPQPIDIDRSEA